VRTRWVSPLHALRMSALRQQQPFLQSQLVTHSGRWMFGCIFGLDGRESYRELRLELLCCPHRLS